MLAPSDFSVLKNFVQKPVHENRLKFFQWFKITSNQLTVNDVICDVVFVNNNTANSLLMNFDCPVDTSSSKTAHQHTQLVPRRTGSKPTAQISLPTRSVASKFTRLEPLGLPCPGAMLKAYHKRHPKPKMIAEQNWRKSCRWSGTAYLSPQGPIRQAVKEFSKRLKSCVAAEGGQFEHSQ